MNTQFILVDYTGPESRYSSDSCRKRWHARIIRKTKPHYREPEFTTEGHCRDWRSIKTPKRLFGRIRALMRFRLRGYAEDRRKAKAVRLRRRNAVKIMANTGALSK